MKALSLRLLEHANALAKEIDAKAVVIYADALAFAISQSTRIVTVFKSGRILTQIQHSAGHRDKRTP